MKSGAKGTITRRSARLHRLAGEPAKRREKFIGEYLITPRGHGAGKPFKLRPFQREIIRGRSRPASAPRSSASRGRTARRCWPPRWGWLRCSSVPPSAEVLVVASDQRQANITLRYAKRMVELNPVLAERVQVYADRLYLPENDAVLLPLPAEPGALARPRPEPADRRRAARRHRGGVGGRHVGVG